MVFHVRLLYHKLSHLIWLKFVLILKADCFCSPDSDQEIDLLSNVNDLNDEEHSTDVPSSTKMKKSKKKKEMT